MRITGQEKVSEGLVRQISNSVHSPSSPKTVSPSENAPSSSISRLATLFRDSGIDVSPTRLQSLESAISALGLTLSDINMDSALRALILQLHGIHLTQSLLQAGSEGEPTIPERLFQLRNAAQAVLDRRGITGEIRTALEALVNDVDAWYTMDTAPNLRDLVLKGGMTFEWRLLAWYRAGKDPEMLNTLFREDMKGVLFNFLRAIRDVGEKTRPGALKSMEENARDLLESITGRQISNLASNVTDKRSVYLEVFWGENRERMQIRIRADGRKEPQKNVLDSRNFSLILEIEASRLGPVYVLMQISGKTLSATVLLKDEDANTLAESMAGEIKDLLRSRGYELGTIRFGVRKKPIENEPPGSTSHSGVDIMG